MKTKLLAKNAYIRVIGAHMVAGDSTEFDITGTDLGNGFVNTSCHAAWYVSGRYSTCYNGGDSMERGAEVGCAHPTVPDNKYTYPAGKAGVECLEDGTILFVQQIHDGSHDQWEYEIGEVPCDFVIDPTGQIQESGYGLCVTTKA